MLSCCPENPGTGMLETPDTATFASGVTQRQEDIVNRLNKTQRRNTNGFRNTSVCCNKSPVLPFYAGGVPESAYLTKKLESCTPYFGRTTKTSGQYTIDLTQATDACFANVADASLRFAQYYRKNPDVCLPTPTEQLNSTLPKPPIGLCQPSRFF